MTEKEPRKNEFEARILKSKSFNRLYNISFLGVIDHFNASSSPTATRRYSRAEHTLSVSTLAKRMGEKLRLDKSEWKLLVSVALCHDIGHLAFSHTTEHVARRLNYPIDHKIQGASIISDVNGDIFAALKEANIDVERVIHLANGDANDELNWIFHGAINIDTIDGIERFLRSFGLAAPFSTLRLVDSLANLSLGQPLDLNETRELDAFWLTKKSFYEIFLLSGVYAQYERQFVAFLSRTMKREIDILPTLSEKDLLRISGWQLRSFDKEKLSRHEKPRWKFAIDHNAELHSIADLDRRYVRVLNVDAGNCGVSST